MNTDIKIMIELQRYWDNVLRYKNDIVKNEESILYNNRQKEEKSNGISLHQEKLKELKVTVKQKEIELSEKDEQISKLEKRRNIIKNEKEMTALEHEFDKVKSDKDNLENELIELFDLIEQKEAQVAALNLDFNDIEKQSSADNKESGERIIRFGKLIDENQQHFDGLVDQLSSAVKAKFLKLIKSQNGKAIAMIQGEICGVCNFQIPFNIIQDVLKENSIVNCTNCGRFLYKKIT